MRVAIVGLVSKRYKTWKAVNDMPKIKLKKRYKEAGDIVPKLLDIGFDFETACDFVNSIEDADVVEVVRCKDCVYFEPSEVTNAAFCDWHRGIFETYPNEFCCHGERKEQ